MKTVDFNGRSIIASCKYCGSPNVTMDRSPIWDDGDWSIPNITPYSNNIFEYERGANIVTPYTRAYCKSCEGDTTILFNTLKERDSAIHLASMLLRLWRGCQLMMMAVMIAFTSAINLIRWVLLNGQWVLSCGIEIVTLK
mgnify:CR=1 FL=1